MRLLLAVDSVASAEMVAGSVAARPWARGAIARALTVIDYSVIPVDLVNETGGQMQLIRPEMKRRAKEVTARALELLRRSGIETEEDIGSGDPRMVIVDTAEEWNADLIFVRSHVYTDITRWMLGSVAHEVLRRASCSVEIVRAAADGSGSNAQGGMRILLATDGSEYSRAAARSISERLWPAGTEAKVINVVDLFSIEDAGSEALESYEGGTEEAKAAVGESVEIISSAGLETTGEVMAGRPKTRIVERAKEWEANLVVVGSHGRRGIKRLLLGSVSEFVANHAHCSTEVIRH